MFQDTTEPDVFPIPNQLWLLSLPATKTKNWDKGSDKNKSGVRASQRSLTSIQERWKAGNRSWLGD